VGRVPRIDGEGGGARGPLPVLAGFRMQFLAGNREALVGLDNTTASSGFLAG